MITPPTTGLGKVAKSSRGLELVRFKDALAVPCVLQSVTLAYSENGVGLSIGAEKASPKVQARDARALGLNTSQKTGLVKFPVPEEVMFDTRAVLTRDQVKDLVYHLNGWLYGGSLGAPSFPGGVDCSNVEAVFVASGQDLAKGPDQTVQAVWEKAHGLDEQAETEDEKLAREATASRGSPPPMTEEEWNRISPKPS